MGWPDEKPYDKIGCEDSLNTHWVRGLHSLEGIAWRI